MENASLSLALLGLDREDPAVLLWEYHHLAEANINGTQDLDREPQYMIGSVTKLFADMALLKSGVILDDPVANFLDPKKKKVPGTFFCNSTPLQA